MAQDQKRQGNSAGNNARIATLCLGIVAGMGGLAYASVPLYKLFCQVTGYGGTTQTAIAADGIQIVDKDIQIRFDANVSPELSWDFKPLQRDVTIKLGEQKQIAYVAKNTSNHPITATATFNVTPQSAGAYFNKMQCFCFTETTLQPGESLEMPVVFFVDPDIANEVETANIHTITLSYTFFETALSQKPLARLSEEKVEENKPVAENKL